MPKHAKIHGVELPHPRVGSWLPGPRTWMTPTPRGTLKPFSLMSAPKAASAATSPASTASVGSPAGHTAAADSNGRRHTAVGWVRSRRWVPADAALRQRQLKPQLRLNIYMAEAGKVTKPLQPLPTAATSRAHPSLGAAPRSRPALPAQPSPQAAPHPAPANRSGREGEGVGRQEGMRCAWYGGCTLCTPGVVSYC